MSIFEHLVEARIQDWIRRGRPHPRGIEGGVDGGTLESQLLGEIVALRQAARAEADAEAREHLRKEASRRQLQLMVILEKSGRPLAARLLEERLNAI